MEYGTETATRHMFVFNGFHGTDCSASIAIAQMEVLAKNAVYGGVNMVKYRDWETIEYKIGRAHV